MSANLFQRKAGIWLKIKSDESIGKDDNKIYSGHDFTGNLPGKIEMELNNGLHSSNELLP